MAGAGRNLNTAAMALRDQGFSTLALFETIERSEPAH
jgi:hypothetical protein